MRHSWWIPFMATSLPARSSAAVFAVRCPVVQTVCKIILKNNTTEPRYAAYVRNMACRLGAKKGRLIRSGGRRCIISLLPFSPTSPKAAALQYTLQNTVLYTAQQYTTLCATLHYQYTLQLQHVTVVPVSPYPLSFGPHYEYIAPRLHKTRPYYV